MFNPESSLTLWPSLTFLSRGDQLEYLLFQGMLLFNGLSELKAERSINPWLLYCVGPAALSERRLHYSGKNG